MNKKTYRQVLDFMQVSQKWLGAKTNQGKSKMAYAIQRLVPQMDKIQSKAIEDLDRIDVKFCSVDENKNIIGGPTEGLPYKFEREKQQERETERTKYFDKDTIEIDPYYCPIASLPENLTEVELFYFTGFVIDPSKVDEIRSKWEKEFDGIEEKPNEDSIDRQGQPGT